MKRVLCILLFSAFPVFADTSPTDPATWYADEYGPLWAGQPGENVDKLLSYYADSVRTHESGGAISVTPKESWLKEPMVGWLENDGWLEAILLDVNTLRINETTASFTASWLDKYEGAFTEVSCGWYLADWQNGQWLFSAYADIDCSKHGLKTEL
jgi:hypothetical protein